MAGQLSTPAEPAKHPPGSVPGVPSGRGPPLSQIPAGTRILAEFRGADRGRGQLQPLDPLAAGEAHVRFGNLPAQRWTRFLHTERLTEYMADPNDLFDAETLKRSGMRPSDVRLVNFRLTFANNVDVDPPVAPSLDSFFLTWRIQGASK